MVLKIMKNITSNPMALDAFNKRFAAGDYEGALKFARDAGYYVEPSVLDLPYLDRFEELQRTKPEWAEVFRVRHHAVVRAQQRARQMATEVAMVAAGQASDPLIGCTVAEKVEAITSGRAGLSPLAAHEALSELDYMAAAEFEARNQVAIRDERMQRQAEEQTAAERQVAREKARQERLQPRIREIQNGLHASYEHEWSTELCGRYVNNKGHLCETRGYQEELRALKLKYQKFESEQIARVTAEIERELDAMEAAK